MQARKNPTHDGQIVGNRPPLASSPVVVIMPAVVVSSVVALWLWSVVLSRFCLEVDLKPEGLLTRRKRRMTTESTDTRQRRDHHRWHYDYYWGRRKRRAVPTICPSWVDSFGPASRPLSPFVSWLRSYRPSYVSIAAVFTVYDEGVCVCIVHYILE